jgi:hypothetical protein
MKKGGTNAAIFKRTATLPQSLTIFSIPIETLSRMGIHSQAVGATGLAVVEGL